MNLGKIPNNETVLLDANIVLYAARGASAQCVGLLRRCAEGEVACIMPAAQFAEVMHRLMMAEARENGWITGTNPAKQLAARPERVRSLYRYEEALRSLLALGVALEPLIREDFITAFALQRHTGLLTNDALLGACAERLRVHAIASADAHLAALRSATLYAPDDVRE